MKGKTIFTLLAAVLLTGTAFSSPKKAMAQGAPVFPSCATVQGSEVANYPAGWHWIAGNSALQYGSDVVYDIGGGKFVQCYCPKPTEGYTPPSMGTQSNWVRVSSVSSDLVGILESAGWMRIENGADFGLSSEPYLVRNLPYSCGAVAGASCTSTVVQNNTGVVSNSVSSSVTTGGNTLSGNTGGTAVVTTGSSQSVTDIRNRLNLNIASGGGCCSTGVTDVSIIGNGSGSVNTVRINSLSDKLNALMSRRIAFD